MRINESSFRQILREESKRVFREGSKKVTNEQFLKDVESAFGIGDELSREEDTGEGAGMGEIASSAAATVSSGFNPNAQDKFVRTVKSYWRANGAGTTVSALIGMGAGIKGTGALLGALRAAPGVANAVGAVARGAIAGAEIGLPAAETAGLSLGAGEAALGAAGSAIGGGTATSVLATVPPAALGAIALGLSAKIAQEAFRTYRIGTTQAEKSARTTGASAITDVYNRVVRRGLQSGLYTKAELQSMNASTVVGKFSRGEALTPEENATVALVFSGTSQDDFISAFKEVEYLAPEEVKGAANIAAGLGVTWYTSRSARKLYLDTLLGIQKKFADQIKAFQAGALFAAQQFEKQAAVAQAAKPTAPVAKPTAQAAKPTAPVAKKPVQKTTSPTSSASSTASAKSPTKKTTG